MTLSRLLAKPAVLIGVVFLLVGLIGFSSVYIVSSSSDVPARTQTICAKGDTCIALLGPTASPDIVTVKTGEYVQFNSADGERHNLSLANDAEHSENVGTYESGDFEGDEAWRVQFKKDGTYAFADKYNPEVNLRVIVYTEGKDYKLE